MIELACILILAGLQLHTTQQLRKMRLALSVMAMEPSMERYINRYLEQQTND